MKCISKIKSIVDDLKEDDEVRELLHKLGKKVVEKNVDKDKVKILKMLLREVK
jgi:hypothetical protein